MAQDLEPIQDKSTSGRYLKYAVDFRERVSLFFSESSIDAHGIAYQLQPNSLLLVVRLDTEWLKLQSLATLNSIERSQAPVRLNYGISGALLFAHARVIDRIEQELTLSIDLPLYKLQRRDALRMRVLDSHDASVHFFGLDMPLLDISAGGLSVLIPLADERLFSAGQKCLGTTMQFLGSQWRIGLEVTSITSTKLKQGPALKVGFKFLRPPADLERIIAKEAYLNSHKIWSRWL